MLLASTVICLVLIGLLIKLRENTAIKVVSWKLNLLSTIGSMLWLISFAFFAINDQNDYINLDFVCNFRSWLLIIASTVLFMPFFLKTFRLGLIFRVTKSLKPQQLTDEKLIYAVLVCVLMDIFILSICLIVDPLTRTYGNLGDEIPIDKLRIVQYTFGYCDSEYYTLVMAIIFGWKAIQLCFGCYTALVVAQVKSNQSQNKNKKQNWHN